MAVARNCCDVDSVNDWLDRCINLLSHPPTPKPAVTADSNLIMTKIIPVWIGSMSSISQQNSAKSHQGINVKQPTFAEDT